MTMKKAVFWDVVPCRNYVNRHIGGTYRLHLQSRRQEETLAGSLTDFFLSSTLKILKTEAIRRLTQFLHGATSQKTAFFIGMFMK
jgi:hypothetical protein